MPDRLSTGAKVEELELVGERLHFQRVSGTGPSEGWISISLKGKELARRVAQEPPKAVASSSPTKPAHFSSSSTSTVVKRKDMGGNFTINPGIS